MKGGEKEIECFKNLREYPFLVWFQSGKEGMGLKYSIN